MFSQAYKTGHLSYDRKAANEDSNINEIRKSNVRTIVQMAESCKYMEAFRSDIEDLPQDLQPRLESLFGTFVEVCLVHMIPRNMWKANRLRYAISEIFSVADEGLALVLLENNAEEWKTVAESGRNVKMNERKRKYTHQKSADGKETCKGWVREGILRFNSFCALVLKGREMGKEGEEDLGKQNHESVKWEERLLARFNNEHNSEDSTVTRSVRGGGKEEEEEEDDDEGLAFSMFDLENAPDTDPDVPAKELESFRPRKIRAV